MSPEVNGNQQQPPPPTARRKKTREMNPPGVDFNASYTSYFSGNNYRSYPNPEPYCSMAEPLSLPVYPFVYPLYPAKPPMSYVLPTRETDYSSLPVDLDLSRPFSDPGASEEDSSDDRTVHRLAQQVQRLAEANRRLSREVSELRAEVNLLRQQRCTDYEPGMLADVVREVRDAARVREDALLARVKHMIEERQLNVVSRRRGTGSSGGVCG